MKLSHVIEVFNKYLLSYGRNKMETSSLEKDSCNQNFCHEIDLSGKC